MSQFTIQELEVIRTLVNVELATQVMKADIDNVRLLARIADKLDEELKPIVLTDADFDLSLT